MLARYHSALAEASARADSSTGPGAASEAPDLRLMPSRVRLVPSRAGAADVDDRDDRARVAGEATTVEELARRCDRAAEERARADDLLTPDGFWDSMKWDE